MSIFSFCPGKKGKKSKGKVVSLSEFLSDDHGTRSGEAVVMAPSKTSWADEMDDGMTESEPIPCQPLTILPHQCRGHLQGEADPSHSSESSQGLRCG